MNETERSGKSEIQKLIDCEFLGEPDHDFHAFIKLMPDSHWSKYDLGAVRLGWEAHKRLSK